MNPSRLDMKRPIPGGFLLALEGTDGTGKSTLAKAVAAALQSWQLDVVLTREPTDGPWGKRLRESALAGRLSPEEELNAFLEDRKDHVQNLIRPALQADRIVVTDRYYFSTVAYQGARGLDPAELLRQNEAIAPEPHLLVIIDLDPAESLARIGGRDGKPNDFENLAQLTRCREIFNQLTKPYLVRLDGRQSPSALCEQTLLAFCQAATRRIADGPSLSTRQRLAALRALYGVAPLPE